MKPDQTGYQDGFREQVRPLLVSSYVLYGIGGTAAATALGFLIRDWVKDSPRDEGTVRLFPQTCAYVAVLEVSF